MAQSLTLMSWRGSEGALKLGRKWGWVMAQGVLLTLLGFMALSYSWATSLISVIMFGYFMIFGGLIQFVGAFWVREWSGFFLELLMGVFGTMVGFMMVNHPIAAGSGLTLLLAVYLMVEGIFRTVSGIMYRFSGSGMSIFGGIVTFLLGLMIYRQWPISALWLIGTFIAVRLLISGATSISLALMLRRLHKN